jgi:hypothetical protein
MQQCKIQREESTGCELDFLMKQLQWELLKLKDTGVSLANRFIISIVAKENKQPIKSVKSIAKLKHT